MKKCPTCNKEFDDAMRFCQTDGTPLVDAAPPVDPYKTMVARPEDIAAAIPPSASSPEPEAEGSASEEVLDIPAVDPKKTMFASEDEIRSAMAEADNPVVDLPEAPPEPTPPKFIAPAEAEKESADSGFSKTTPPIPLPFGTPPEPVAPSEPSFADREPEPPIFAQPDPPAPAFNPFEHSAPEPKAPIAQAEFTPPPAAQDQSWQNEPMQNPQFQPGSGVPAAGGQNQTLAIISLVTGILSLFCCAWFIPGLAAVIMGFLARSKANNDPSQYGGAGFALGGIVTGAISLVLGVVVLILYFLGFAASLMQQNF